MSAPRLWPVLAGYLLAVVAIIAFSGVAAAFLRALYPDLSDEEVFTGLPALVAGAIGASVGLVTTVLVVARPFDLGRLRLRPGRETGGELAVMILGTLALGQALDSFTVLAGLGNQGSMALIRRALEGAAGPALFVAVLALGVLAGAAEELFFRGWLQTELRARWPPWRAVLVTSLGFGALHLEWLHALLAFVIGLYLGFITERAGSALPAIAAHVVNNVVFTLLTAATGAIEGVRANVLLGVASTLFFVGAVRWLLREETAGRRG